VTTISVLPTRHNLVVSTVRPASASLDPSFAPHPLDHPVWSSLTTTHARFAEAAPGVRSAEAGALRFPADISPFVAFRPNGPHESGFPPRIWADLAELVGPDTDLFVAAPAALGSAVPPAWRITLDLPGVQMVSTDTLIGAPDPEAVVLGDDDVDEMLDLVRRTEPGPFLPRTRQLGTYLGIRRAGELVAMAGERLQPSGRADEPADETARVGSSRASGWTEISAVCTAPAFRGQGMATRLIRAVAHDIRRRGRVPFLHASATNTTAIAIYRRLGFEIRARPTFYLLHTPS
jgi:ribosomal protein S18 acetylase RimI-like enzyme